MGACCGKEDRWTAEHERRKRDGRGPPRAFQGAGHTLGGGGADRTTGADAKDAAAMAAMQRANKPGTDRDRRLAARRQKDDLVGKILAHYQARGQDAPVGLPASDVETLKRHLAKIKKEAATKKGSSLRRPQIAL